MPRSNEPARSVVHKVIFVLPSTAANSIPAEPPPPYSLTPPNPLNNAAYFSQNRFNSHTGEQFEMRHDQFATLNEVSNAQTYPYDDRRNERDSPRVKINKHYLASGAAVFKAVEIVACLLAFCACASFRHELGLGLVSGDRSGFFIMLTFLCWLLVIVLFCLNLIGYIDAVKKEVSFVKMLVIHISIGCVLLVSSTLLVDLQIPNLCKSLSSTCTTYKVAVGCGYFAMLIFWIDAALHFKAFQKSPRRL